MQCLFTFVIVSWSHINKISTSQGMPPLLVLENILANTSKLQNHDRRQWTIRTLAFYFVKLYSDLKSVIVLLLPNKILHIYFYLSVDLWPGFEIGRHFVDLLWVASQLSRSVCRNDGRCVIYNSVVIPVPDGCPSKVYPFWLYVLMSWGFYFDPRLNKWIEWAANLGSS